MWEKDKNSGRKKMNIATERYWHGLRRARMMRETSHAKGEQRAQAK